MAIRGEMDLDVRSVLDMQLHNDMVMDNRWLLLFA